MTIVEHESTMTNKPKDQPIPLDLGDTEIEVLNHVWDLQFAKVSDVHERISEERKVAYTTVMTVMRKLSKKGLLDFGQEGNAYRPAVSSQRVLGGLIRRLLNRAFSGSPAALVQTLVSAEELTSEELDDLDRLIRQLRGKS